MHIGCNDNIDFCPQLKTHGEVMIKTYSESYLGDIIESNGKNTKNINARCGRGWGIITNITMILREVCLGQFYYTIALILRESLLFSSMLLNSESWTNVTAAEVNQLEKIDKALIKKILSCPAKTTVCFLFLETAALPIKNVLMGKRIMFLHCLLNLPETDLTSRVFHAQAENPIKNDWVLQKDTKSKMRNLNYESFNIQPYLVSDKLSLRQKQLICKIRAGMIETPDNYGRDVPCRLCYLARDEMSHVLDCIVLKLACPELYLNSDVSINDAYEGNNMEKLKNLAIVFQEAWRTREKLTK